jgi:tRNA threonylcarbamoyladenosine biosynthesis protein TsaE
LTTDSRDHSPGQNLVTRSGAETAAVGEALGGYLRDGDVVLLHGDLGAGKTTLAKGIASALGICEVVSSPSFALVNEYDTDSADVSHLFHLDLYRLRDENDLASIGFDDLVACARGAILIEWPERAVAALPERYLLIEIENRGSDERHLRFVPGPDEDAWSHRIEHLCSYLAPNPD